MPDGTQLAGQDQRRDPDVVVERYPLDLPPGQALAIERLPVDQPSDQERERQSGHQLDQREPAPPAHAGSQRKAVTIVSVASPADAVPHDELETPDDARGMEDVPLSVARTCAVLSVRHSELAQGGLVERAMWRSRSTRAAAAMAATMACRPLAMMRLIWAEEPTRASTPTINATTAASVSATMGVPARAHSTAPASRRERSGR